MFDAPDYLLVDEQELNRLGCSITYERGYSNNLCNGIFCEADWNCLSDCCSYNHCQNECHYALAWLWWTLSFTLLFCCLMSIILGARRRRMMALRAAA